MEIISTVASAKSPAIIASFFDRPIETIPNLGMKINLGFPSSSIVFFTNSIDCRQDARTFNDRASCYRLLDNNELAIKDYLSAIDLKNCHWSE